MSKFRFLLVGAALILIAGGPIARPAAAADPQDRGSRRARAAGEGQSRGGGEARAVPRSEARPADRTTERRDAPAPPPARASARDDGDSASRAAAQRGNRSQGGRPSRAVPVPRRLAPQPPRGLLPTIRPRIYYYPRPSYGAFGYFSYDPYPYYYGAPGYYQGYGAPGYYQGYGAYGYGEGGLRLKVRPRDAIVEVDGYYVGRVDDFDGTFQRLNLDPRPHTITVRAPGYEPLSFDVRIVDGRTTTYEADLRPLQP